jgi:hypothetical protein
VQSHCVVIAGFGQLLGFDVSGTFGARFGGKIFRSAVAVSLPRSRDWIERSFSDLSQWRHQKKRSAVIRDQFPLAIFGFSNSAKLRNASTEKSRNRLTKI